MGQRELIELQASLQSACNASVFACRRTGRLESAQPSSYFVVVALPEARKAMELRQLRYFLAVAEHLHFTDAAAHLGIAQPPLSQQILKLEREIGTQLFIRHPRRVELTEAGRLLRESARRIVEDAQQALVEAQNAGRGETGHL